MIADWLEELCPLSNKVYVNREPLGWLESAYRTFVDPAHIHDLEVRERMENGFSAVNPLIKDYRQPAAPMPHYKIWILNWISNSEALGRRLQAGSDFLQMDYEDLVEDPGAAVRRLFDYCGIVPEDWAKVLEALELDSQEGTTFARTLVRQPERELPASAREAAGELLRARGYVLEEPG